MRPIYHKKADRLYDKAGQLKLKGAEALARLKARDENAYNLVKRAFAHVIMSLGGESEEDTDQRLEAHGPISDDEVIDGICAVMNQDAFNHKRLQATDGRLANGMSTMFMGASTGCNTVYGSTPPSNPHPYPWMNSLFQDGPTISWLLGESLTGRRLAGAALILAGIYLVVMLADPSSDTVRKRSEELAQRPIG